MVAATTAGNDPSGFAAQEHAYCEKVASGQIEDPTRFVYIRNVPKNADWRDEKEWKQSNPALGEFLSLQVLRDEAREAENDPQKENTFRQFRLNQWVQQRVRWIPLHLWDANGETPWLDSEVEGKSCYAGLDLAESSDLSAWCLVFPWDDGVRVKWRFWVPEESLTKLDKRLAGQASVWARDGILTVTPGNIADYDTIERAIARDAETYDIKEIGYDPWHGSQLIQHLNDGGLTVAKVQQTMAVLTDACTELERLLDSEKLHHKGNPVARWMADNVVLKRNAEGTQKKPDKKNTDKTDGIAALLNALERLIRAEPESEVNISLI